MAGREVPAPHRARPAEGSRNRTRASGSPAPIPTTAGGWRSATCSPSRGRSPKRSSSSRRSRPPTNSAPPRTAASPTGTWSRTAAQQHEKARAAVYKTTERVPPAVSGSASTCARGRAPTGHLPTQLDPEVLTSSRRCSRSPRRRRTTSGSCSSSTRRRATSGCCRCCPTASSATRPARSTRSSRGCSRVLDEVRDEATADELVKRIAEVRPSAKTAVDQRALDLLELLVERRAAELQNQPGPHADKALAALRARLQARVVARRAAADGRLPRGARQRPATGAREGATAPIGGAAPRRRGRLVRPVAHRPPARRDAQRLLAPRRRRSTCSRRRSKEFEDANNGVLPTSANSALDDSDFASPRARGTTTAARSCCSRSSSTRSTPSRRTGSSSG